MWIAELFGLLGLFGLGCAAGFVLFGRPTVPQRPGPVRTDKRLSVIIPARNEERNLPHLLDSLAAQTFSPYEVIVVDDGSEDRTKAIAERYRVKVVANPSLPSGWTGKNWAVWNGCKQATGDLIAFLDADIRLAPHALASLVQAREQSDGAISVVPFHYTELLYERLSLVFNLLGLFAFTSPFERNNPRKGLYGSCIVTSREQYERAGGHESIKSEVLDDLGLGARYRAAGIPVTNYIGCGTVSFRMYPDGLKSEIEGFGKGAVLSTSMLSGGTIALVALWVVGLLAAGSAVCWINTSLFWPFLAGYLLYMAQIFYFIKYTGRFGIVVPVLHAVSSLFFVTVMAYSAYQVVFRGHVAWKGRRVKVGGG